MKIEVSLLKAKKKFTSFITYMRTCHIFQLFGAAVFLTLKSGYARFAKIFEEFHFIVVGMLNVFKKTSSKWQ